jgi:hypothetical protein
VNDLELEQARETVRRLMLALLEVASLRQLEIIAAFLETMEAHPDY